MKQPIACFVHKGHNRFLSIAVAHAAYAGLKPVVIGDLQAKCRDAEFIDIREFERSAQQFRDVYNHVSVNNYEYESFCYERWFFIQEFMRNVSEPVWVLDHDVLTFDGLTSVGDIIAWAKYPRPFMFDSAWTTLITDILPLELLTAHFCKVFEDSAIYEPMSRKYAQEGRPHLSDMFLLVDLGQTSKTLFVDAFLRGEEIGIDQNIRLGKFAQMYNGYKEVAWRQKNPYVKLKNGDYQRFYTLHFQGEAKWLMPFLAQVPFENEQSTKEWCTRMANSQG